MLRLSKLSVSQVLTRITRQFAGKGSKEGGKDGGSACAPVKKFDLCESKKSEKDGKGGKIEKCGGEGGGSMGGVGRQSSCKPKKQTAPKGSTSGTLRKVCLFGILPTVFLLNILIFSTRAHEEREEFKKWPHLYKRDKRFPWGDGQKSLFHNPHTNPLPDTGYEDEV